MQKKYSALIFLLTLLSFAGLMISQVSAAPAISQITDNRGSYSGNQIPRYNKLEVTFQVANSVAQNFQLPYDPTPPPGIDPNVYPKHKGISVDAVFTAPDGKNYSQPAFIYQPYTIQGLPDGNKIWKVRFAPNIPGIWSYYLTAKDASGTTSTQNSPNSFTVGASINHGFIKVSSKDPRYFEFDDGTYFPAIGRHSRSIYDQPGSGDRNDYLQFGSNGITLIRDWMSGFYGSAWLHWKDGRNTYDHYLPRTGLEGYKDPASGLEYLTMVLAQGDYTAGGWYYNCRRQDLSFPQQLARLKTNTNYRVAVTYTAQGIAGPRLSNYSNYGFVAKIGGWADNCGEPDNLPVVTNYGGNSSGWSTIQGTWNSGNQTEARIHLAMENAVNGKVWIKDISLKEDLGNNQYGPEMVSESSAEYESYYPERMAYEIDKAIEAANDANIYLKLVVMDKGDMLWWKIQNDGTFVIAGEQDEEQGFYGNWRFNDKKRWLQNAYFRYLQARWGYSPNIHSWELTNEGEPYNGNHWASVDEMGKAFHCRVFGISIGTGDSQKCNFEHPNKHLVTTSFYHSYPDSDFWVNPKYPNVDYADVHAYISTGWQSNPEHQYDAALFHWDYAKQLRESTDRYAAQVGIATKPIVRGETGIDYLNNQTEQPDLSKDKNGVWLHNFTWASLSKDAMIELYWWGETIDSQPGPDGNTANGLMEIYKYFYDFLQNIPLNNGNYKDAQSVLSNSNLRVAGQKDTVNNRAHLWVQNKNHTWKKVVDGTAQTGLSGTVKLTGFSPNTNLNVEWHKFKTNGQPIIANEQMSTDSSGTLTLNLPTDSGLTDAGVKVGSYTLSPTPTTNPTLKPGDANGDGKVDFIDYAIWRLHFGQTTANGAVDGDFNNSNYVDFVDYAIWRLNFGK